MQPLRPPRPYLPSKRVGIAPKRCVLSCVSAPPMAVFCIGDLLWRAFAKRHLRNRKALDILTFGWLDLQLSMPKLTTATIANPT